MGSASDLQAQIIKDEWADYVDKYEQNYIDLYNNIGSEALETEAVNRSLGSVNDAFTVANNSSQRSAGSYGLSLNRNNANDSLHKTAGLAQGAERADRGY